MVRKDTQTVIMEESVRRLVEEVREAIDNGEIEVPVSCPLEEKVGYERMRDLVALNVAMSRIIRSVGLN